MAENEKEKAEPQICPLLTLALAVRIHGNDVIDADLRNCLKEKCALWVELVKEVVDPFGHYEYKGCGLIQHVGWVYIKHEKKKETQ